jgi:MFS family permease
MISRGGPAARSAGGGQPGSAPNNSWRMRFAFPLLALAFTAIMLGTTLPTPLYALYAERMHFSVLTGTVVFAAFVAGVLAALLTFGRWSDAVGRRPMLLLAILLALVSAVVFLIASDRDDLLMGRVLSGLSGGVASGTATAAVIEAAPESWKSRSAAVAAAANVGGMGLGPLLAGLLVQYAPDPLKLAFVVHIVLMGFAVAIVSIVPETSPRTGTVGFQRLSVPAEVRPTFITAGIAGFAGCAVLGFFNAVSPSFVAHIIGIENHAMAGAIVGLIFASSVVAQLAFAKVEPNKALAVGSAVLVVGMLIIAASLHFSSLVLLIFGTVVAGVGQGITFSRGLYAVVERTPSERRAEVTSSYFVVLYIGTALPAVGVGLAIEDWGLRTAGIVFAFAVLALAAIGLVAILLRERGARRQPANQRTMARVSEN